MTRGEITGRKPHSTPDRARRRPRPPRADPDAIEPTPHGEPQTNASTAPQRIRGPPTPPACFSIASFCVAHHLSESMFFKMRAEGWGPAEMRVGSRVLITFEAATRWRAQREAASKAEAGATTQQEAATA
jgi:hypothetical protein